jgi:aliphatic nitrilase
LIGCVEPKQFHDVVGYYNRFDIFKLTVNRAANRPISFEGTPEPERDERLPAAEDMSQEPPQ